MRRIRLSIVGVLGVLGMLLVSSPSVTAATTGSAANTGSTGPELVADWELNDAPGSPVMSDGSGNGHDGTISAAATSAGLTLDGTVYQWSLRCPACLPAAPARVVQVADSSQLDVPDPKVPYTIEFRFKTHKGYGNIMQKGQGTSAGGQIKIENPNGYTSCVFLGAGGNYVSVRGTRKLNDGVWHTVSCVHTATYVAQRVDGVQVGRKNRRTGPIDNAKPFVIGGKPSCNQVTVTCDYYSGYLDWVRITSGGPVPVPSLSRR